MKPELITITFKLKRNLTPTGEQTTKWRLRDMLNKEHQIQAWRDELEAAQLEDLVEIIWQE